MEVGRGGRLSISGRSEANSVSPSLDRPPKLSMSSGNHTNHHEQQQQQQKNRASNYNKMTRNRVQVVYYLTRNGHLEHPHFMEVSHLATQPLRLFDVIDRLTVLRGKAMPFQYSWSCKRSYKNGYVWNDLTENDAIYACDSEGSEYVLKGSEIILDPDFSETSRLEELQIKRRLQRKGGQTNTDGSVTNKSRATHDQTLYNHHRQISTSTLHNGKHHQHVKNYDQTTENNHHNDDDDDDDDDDEEKGSCNSSNNAPYATLQMEQEESLSVPSTSSTNSDKHPPPPVVATAEAAAAESKRYQKEASRVIQEDGDTTMMSTSLTRNSTAHLLHLIACGGGSIAGPKNKTNKNNININSIGTGNGNGNGNGSDSSRSLNYFRVKNSLMPCLKQQLSSRGQMNPLPVKEQTHCDYDDNDQVRLSKKKELADEEDEDMMMVRYMSENPRFGNLQSEEKEYFSGTIVEATSSDHHQTDSSVSALTKSSSYNEHCGTKLGSQVEAGAWRVQVEEEEDEKEEGKAKGIIKLCIPRKKSFTSSTSVKHIC